MKSFVLFIFGALLFGAVALGAGFFILGSDVLVQGSVAFALTSIPAAATLAWVIHSYRRAPDMQLLAGLGGSGVRLFIALGGGFFLTKSQPDIFDKALWSWLILFYLGLLGFEIAILVRGQPNANGSPQA
jgi:hypothetical protein